MTTVSPVKTEQFTMYVANLKKYGKTKKLKTIQESNFVTLPRIMIKFNPGLAEPLSDKDEIMEIWNSNTLLRKFSFAGDNPELIIYRITPNHVRFMREWALEYYDVPIS